MDLENLTLFRQEKGYSIDMIASLLNNTVEYYMELEFGLRKADQEEMAVLDQLFSEIC